MTWNVIADQVDWEFFDVNHFRGLRTFEFVVWLFNILMKHSEKKICEKSFRHVTWVNGWKVDGSVERLRGVTFDWYFGDEKNAWNFLCKKNVCGYRWLASGVVLSFCWAIGNYILVAINFRWKRNKLSSLLINYSFSAKKGQAELTIKGKIVHTTVTIRGFMMTELVRSKLV